MTKRVRISFNVIPAEKGAMLRPLIESMDCASGWKEPEGFRVIPSFDCTFDADDKRLTALRELIHREKIDALERIDYFYTEDELRSAPLLMLSIGIERDSKGQTCDRFDFSTACPCCGIGARQIAPLVIPNSSLPKKGSICRTLEGYILLSQPLRDALVKADLSGPEFRQVVSPRGEPLNCWQMSASFEMPPMNEETRRRLRGRLQDGCPKCGRDNFFDGKFEPVLFTYDRSSLGDLALPDVVRTYECFGISGFNVKAWLAQPYILVKPKVFDIFRRLKVRGVDFDPVIIREK